MLIRPMRPFMLVFPDDQRWDLSSYHSLREISQLMHISDFFSGQIHQVIWVKEYSVSVGKTRTFCRYDVYLPFSLWNSWKYLHNDSTKDNSHSEPVILSIFFSINWQSWNVEVCFLRGKLRYVKKNKVWAWRFQTKVL